MDNPRATPWPTTRQVSRERLGAWLLKATPGPGWQPEPDADGRRVFRERCVSRGYRAQMMRPGDPVLLWVSGPASTHGPTPGIWGIGTVVAAATTNDEGQLAVAVELPLAEKVLLARDELLALPGLDALEVLRMPAGPNPSWVTAAQWAELRHRL